MSERDTGAPGYMTYREAAIMFSLMDDISAAKAIKATVSYYLEGTIPELDGAALKVFEIMRRDIDRNNVKYEEIREKRRKAAERRWNSKQ